MVGAHNQASARSAARSKAKIKAAFVRCLIRMVRSLRSPAGEGTPFRGTLSLTEWVGVTLSLTEWVSVIDNSPGRGESPSCPR